jgi:phage gp36-like protein
MAARATVEQLENRLSAAVVARLFDDDNDGTADSGPLAQLLLDAASKVDSYLAPLGMLPLSAPYPNEIIRLELDIAQAYAAQRFPETVRVDWEKLMAQAEKDLDRLRMGKTMLGQSPPDPGANQGATAIADNADHDFATDGSVRRWDDMGDF